MPSQPIDAFTIIYALVMALPAGIIATIAMRNANMCDTRTPYVLLANVTLIASSLLFIYSCLSRSYDEAQRARARIL